jgi:hypothetical protein
MVLPLQLGCAIAMSPFNSASLTCATCLGASVLARAHRGFKLESCAM